MNLASNSGSNSGSDPTKTPKIKGAEKLAQQHITAGLIDQKVRL